MQSHRQAQVRAFRVNRVGLPPAFRVLTPENLLRPICGAELGDEQDLTSGLAPFQFAVRLCHFGERKGKFYTHLQLA